MVSVMFTVICILCEMYLTVSNNAQLCRRDLKIQISLMGLIHSHPRNLKLHNISEKRWKIYLGKGIRGRAIIQRRRLAQ
jgi:hypothetical protein